VTATGVAADAPACISGMRMFSKKQVNVVLSSVAVVYSVDKYHWLEYIAAAFSQGR
jgi:hypothetical protein